MLTVMAALFYANGAGYVALTAALYHPHPVLGATGASPAGC